MKKLTILVITILLAKISFGQICNGQTVVLTEDGQCDYNPWVLVFEDNFDGNALDLSKWNLPYQGVVRDFTHAKEKQWYANTGSTPTIPISNNIEVSNGTLKLIARRESTPITGTYVSNFATTPWTYTTENFDYSSAEIDSKYKFGYGKFEIRCQVPAGKGFWPAYWMYGIGSTGANNEIDVFEFWDNSTRDHNMTAHYAGGMCGSDYNNGPDYAQGFHTFAIIWDNYKIEWWTDGVLRRRSTKFNTMLGQTLDCNSIQAFGQYILEKVFPRDPMNIILNLALQTGTYQPDANTPFPGYLVVDYVRYSKKMGCPGNVNATNITQFNLSNVTYNLVIGTTITVGGNFTISNGQQLELMAQDQIILDPGFIADAGCHFSASINPAICPGLIKPQDFSYNDSDEDSLSTINNLKNTIIYTTSQPIKNFKIKTFPNPNSGLLFVEFEQIVPESFELYLMDMQGKIVYTLKPVRESKIEINMNDFKKGNYILNILDTKNKNAYVDKIIFN